jgi:SAM-dependent methyltransferase
MSEATLNLPAAADYLDTAFVAKGIGGWRALYLRFIEALAPRAVLEVGAGTPDFLASLTAARRIAIDVGERFAPQFAAAGIEFLHADLEHDEITAVRDIDVAVCSDVFEHLLHPAAALDRIAQTLAPGGVLFSHVPNEFRLRHLARVAFGTHKSSEFHATSAEWDDPHLRRFTPTGFRRFLERRFTYNLPLSAMRHRGIARVIDALGAPVPYCLQGGPTFVSTNDAKAFERLRVLKRRLSRGA